MEPLLKDLNKELDRKGDLTPIKLDRKYEGEQFVIDIRSRIDELKVEPSTPADGFHDNVWDRFTYVVSGKWIEEQDDNWKAPYTEGEWELEGSSRLAIGHSPQLTHTYIPKGGGMARHHYSKPPKAVVWNLTPLTQKGRVFFIGKAKVSEIDAVCSVPQLPAEMDSYETGLRVLNKKRGSKQWQRRVDPARIKSIKRFIKRGGNMIANSVILYAPEHPAVKSKDDGTVKIAFSKFLHKAGGDYRDRRGKTDLRPIWLIDGQHRTRGLAQSEVGIDMEIPIIFFPSDFDLNESAKIFSEINTLQVKLTALHTLFMQHRFSISSPTTKRDFSVPWKDKDGAVTNPASRANHLAYECAAYLAQSDERDELFERGPLNDRIQFLDANSNRTTIMKANQWVDYAREWFLEGPYPPGCPETQAWINEEVENYFEAFVRTCNHSGWKKSGVNPDKRRWVAGAKGKGLVQKHGPSQALIKIYRTAWRKARANNAVPTNEIIPVKRFLEVLSPLKWCDWIDSDLNSVFYGSGERPRTALRVWLKSAINHGISYPYEKVMSNKLKSKPGRGMLAPPGKGVLRKEGDRGWPVPGKAVKIVAEQPVHSLSTSGIEIRDSNDVEWTSTNVQARNGVVEYLIRHQAWMDDVSWMRIRVSWRNTVTPASSAALKLIKD